MSSRIRAPGLWTFDSVVSGAEFEAFDANLAEAIDGRGGVYDLDEPLVIGGDTVRIVQNLDVNGSLEVDISFTVNGDAAIVGDLSVGDDLTVINDLSVGGTGSIDGSLGVGTELDVGGNLTVDFAVGIGTDLLVGDDATITNDLIVGGNVDVTGNIGLDGNINVGGDVVVTDDLDVGNDLDVVGDALLGGAGGVVQFRGITTAQKPLSFTGDGKIVWRQQVAATDANQTVVAAQVDSFYWPNGILSVGTRNVTIDDTGAANGMRVIFRSADTSFSFLVKDPGGGNLESLHGTTKQWGYAERINGAWVWFGVGVP